MEYVTRGVCGQEGCRERRYYLDNGLWYCRRGHLQEVCNSQAWLCLLWLNLRIGTSHKAEVSKPPLPCQRLSICAGPTSRRGSRRLRDSRSKAPSEEG